MNSFVGGFISGEEVGNLDPHLGQNGKLVSVIGCAHSGQNFTMNVTCYLNDDKYSCFTIRESVNSLCW